MPNCQSALIKKKCQICHQNPSRYFFAFFFNQNLSQFPFPMCPWYSKSRKQWQQYFRVLIVEESRDENGTPNVELLQKNLTRHLTTQQLEEISYQWELEEGGGGGYKKSDWVNLILDHWVEVYFYREQKEGGLFSNTEEISSQEGMDWKNEYEAEIRELERAQEKHKEQLEEKSEMCKEQSEQIKSLEIEKSELTGAWDEIQAKYEDQKIEYDRERLELLEEKNSLTVELKREKTLNAQLEEEKERLDERILELSLQQQRQQNQKNFSCLESKSLDNINALDVEGESEGENEERDNEKGENFNQDLEIELKEASEVITKMEGILEDQENDMGMLEDMIDNLKLENRQLKCQLDDRTPRNSPAFGFESLSQFQDGMPPTPETPYQSPPSTPTPFFFMARSPTFSSPLGNLGIGSRQRISGRGKVWGHEKEMERLNVLRGKVDDLETVMENFKNQRSTRRYRPMIQPLCAGIKARGGMGEWLAAPLAFFLAVIMSVVMLLSHSLNSPTGGNYSSF